MGVGERWKRGSRRLGIVESRSMRTPKNVVLLRWGVSNALAGVKARKGLSSQTTRLLVAYDTPVGAQRCSISHNGKTHTTRFAGSDPIPSS